MLPTFTPFGLHKLEYRSKPCIFLGYSYAGYKCLDPITNKVYLSRHVVFDEQNFPAKDQASSHLPSKINAIGDVPFILPVSLLPTSVSGSPNSSSVTPVPAVTLHIPSAANTPPASESDSATALPNVHLNTSCNAFTSFS
jgi:hypothetical protein